MGRASVSMGLITALSVVASPGLLYALGLVCELWMSLGLAETGPEALRFGAGILVAFQVLVFFGLTALIGRRRDLRSHPKNPERTYLWLLWFPTFAIAMLGVVRFSRFVLGQNGVVFSCGIAPGDVPMLALVLTSGLGLLTILFVVLSLRHYPRRA